MVDFFPGGAEHFQVTMCIVSVQHLWNEGRWIANSICADRRFPGVITEFLIWKALSSSSKWSLWSGCESKLPLFWAKILLWIRALQDSIWKKFNKFPTGAGASSLWQYLPERGGGVTGAVPGFWDTWPADRKEGWFSVVGFVSSKGGWGLGYVVFLMEFLWCLNCWISLRL